MYDFFYNYKTFFLFITQYIHIVSHYLRGYQHVIYRFIGILKF